MEYNEERLIKNSVHLSDINRFLKKINKDLKGRDAMISFDFIMISLFPSIYSNIKEFGAQQYIHGYNDGLKERK